MTNKRKKGTPEQETSNHSQSRSWMLTLKADDYSQDDVVDKLKSYAYIGQLEEGTKTGYTHWQVYVENATPIAFSTLKRKFPTGHFEVRKGTKWQCYQYVTKEESSLGVTIGSESFVIPEPDRDGKTASVEKLRSLMIGEGKSFRDVLLTEPVAAQHVNYLRELESQVNAHRWGNCFREVEVQFVFGASGVGKTSSVYERFGFEDVYSVGSYSNPWDAYNGEGTILLDEFAGQLEFEFLLKLLDRYPLRLPARYADRWAGFSRVVILSNLPLGACYPFQREHRPAQWRALTRRITTYGEMLLGGQIVPRELPEPLSPGSVPSSAGDGSTVTAEEFAAMMGVAGN